MRQTLACIALFLALLEGGQSLSHTADIALPEGVTLHKQGHGWRLGDESGMTLYTYALDLNPSKSACTGACAETWLPVIPKSNVPTTSEWSSVPRADGQVQLSFRGKPLYRYKDDVAPGDTFGDEINNQWNVAFKLIPLPPGVSVTKTPIGHVLSDAAGKTFYVNERGGKSCTEECIREWRPVVAPAIARAFSDWTVVTRPNGLRQWAYKNQPLFRYDGDIIAGDTFGATVDKDWRAAILEPAPAVPDWITVQGSDAGDLLADSEGRTLYTFTNRRGRGDGGVDRPQDWIAVEAARDAKPVGYWSVVTNDNGSRQWAYKGNRVYTNRNDKAPGDTNGVRAIDRRWGTIMRSGQQMQATGV